MKNMKWKRLAIMGCVGALTIGASVTAFAATKVKQKEQTTTQITGAKEAEISEMILLGLEDETQITLDPSTLEKDADGNYIYKDEDGTTTTIVINPTEAGQTINAVPSNPNRLSGLPTMEMVDGKISYTDENGNEITLKLIETIEADGQTMSKYQTEDSEVVVETILDESAKEATSIYIQPIKNR